MFPFKQLVIEGKLSRNCSNNISIMHNALLLRDNDLINQTWKPNRKPHHHIVLDMLDHVIKDESSKIKRGTGTYLIEETCTVGQKVRCDFFRIQKSNSRIQWSK